MMDTLVDILQFKLQFTLQRDLNSDVIVVDDAIAICPSFSAFTRVVLTCPILLYRLSTLAAVLSQADHHRLLRQGQ